MFKKILPDYLFQSQEPESAQRLFNYRRIWLLAVSLTLALALVPLVISGMINYTVTRQAIESENFLRTSRVVSNTKRNVANYFQERKLVLDFIARMNSFEQLSDPGKLSKILTALQNSIGGIVDLGIINSQGQQLTYVGPYDLVGKNYAHQKWFNQVQKSGSYISDVFFGYRNKPHIIVASAHQRSDNELYFLRATLSLKQLNSLLASLDLIKRGDAFVINPKGILQTQSRYHGNLLGHVDFEVPAYTEHTQVKTMQDDEDESYIVGYAHIPETPFIVMIAKPYSVLMQTWYKLRAELLGILVLSVLIVTLTLVGITTFLVNRIYLADQRQQQTLQKVQHANKMASIGQLAAGVAHEVNNPLAIINEKAGLLKDFFTIKKQYAHDPQSIQLIDSILDSVGRCTKITRRLLSFARQVDVHVGQVKIQDVVYDILEFLRKEADYRSIKICVDIPDNLPPLVSDRGKLQQILLNLINNAFSALSDQGHLEICARAHKDNLFISVCDNGHGIPREHLEKIFDPFFSTKLDSGGTGLGLSITYGLVRELGGQIEVDSQEGRGTTFTITLPLEMKQDTGEA